MTNELYKFLKSKGLEFCYKDKEPFLVDSHVHVDYLQEYADIQNKKLLIMTRDEFIKKWLTDLVPEDQVEAISDFYLVLQDEYENTHKMVIKVIDETYNKK